MMKNAALLCLLLVLATGTIVADPAPGALEVGDLRELKGFTLVEVSSVAGTLEDAKHYAEYYGRVVKLGNGWLFDCQSYLYHYSPHPEVAVFAKTTDYRYQGRQVVFYKLLIEGKIYDASRAQ